MTRRARRLRLWRLALALAAAAASAPARSAEIRNAAPGDFDFYVLALSWSSGFCEIEGDRKRRDQCETGAGLGFVTHGLWPQNERGYPVYCGPGQSGPPRAAMALAREAFPDEGLARYQWRKHGGCSGAAPAAYFDDVRTAVSRVRVPEHLRAPDREVRAAPIDIERAFVAANPGLRADMIAVGCNRAILQEVRICFTKDLRGFRPCAEVDGNACRVREVRIPPVR